MIAQKQKKTSQIDQLFFYVLVRSWNSFKYFDRCIDSILNQKYALFQIIFVDDCSNYNAEQKKYMKQKLANHKIIFNKKRKYSIRNAYEVIHKCIKNDDAVVVSVDGDDWLANSEVLTTLNKTYQNENCFFSYGSCSIWNDSRIHHQSSFDPIANTAYPSEVIKDKSFRTIPFRPLHLRSWKVWLFKKINLRDFLYVDRSWLRFCEDMAIFFPFLEMYPKKYVVISDILYIYNRETINNDIKVNRFETIREEIFIRKKTPYEQKS